MRKPRFLRGTLAVPIAILLSVMAAGCGSNKTGHLIPNDQPFVKITGGPLEGSRQSYTARVYWSGWDYDGIVDHYEYAVDPPAKFSELEIARPDSFPDINIRIIPGPSIKEDTLVVSKVVDGKTYSFLWVKTPEFNHSFAFTTDNADSAAQGTQLKPTGEFSGLHRIYVRCQDDDGAYSILDSNSKLAYTASTLAPTSEITKPNIKSQTESGFLNVGPTITISWDGTDGDSPDPRKKPVGYLYKLLDVSLLQPPPLLTHVNPSFLYSHPRPNTDDKGDPAWHYQSADTLKKTFFLTEGDGYIFGVRAVDVANAVEPFLDGARNAFRFQSFHDAGSPTLTVREPALGSFSGNGSARPAEVKVPVGGKLRFNWSANAEEYGGAIDAYSWGFDIPDLDRDGPGSGWSGWGKTDRVPAPIIVDNVSTHVFYVRVRDTSGTITTVSILLHFVDFELDHKVLFVDDIRNLGGYEPTDVMVDAFWKDMFQNSGRFPVTGPLDSVYTFSSFGLNDSEHIPPVWPAIDFLGQFQLIIWNADLGYNGVSALFDVTGYKNRYLGAYLAAGGKLWVFGKYTVADMVKGGTSANNLYPLAPEPGDFAYDFMKLASNSIENAKSGNRTNPTPTSANDNMIGVVPYPWPPSDTTHVNPYPRADQDSIRWNPFRRAIGYADAVFDPIYSQNIDGFPATGKIDSLYIYKAVRTNSSYNDRLTAIRYRDLNPDRAQGRTQWFGFDPYWLKTDQFQEVFNRTIDWFNEERSPGQVP